MQLHMIYPGEVDLLREKTSHTHTHTGQLASNEQKIINQF